GCAPCFTGIGASTATNNGFFNISNNIMRFAPQATNPLSHAISIQDNNNSTTLNLWNNIIYSETSNVTGAAILTWGTMTTNAYNNTIVNFPSGIGPNSGSPVTRAKNN